MGLTGMVLYQRNGCEMDVDAVDVPETTCPLSQEHLDELVATVDPLRESNSYGIDIYLETLEFVNAHIR